MNIHRILWKGIYYNTLEYLHIQSGTTHKIVGNITGIANEQPLHVHYEIHTNLQWEMLSVDIQLTDHVVKKLQFSRQDNRWHDQHGTIHAIFDNCVDVDISLTPFTNTLPINRLSLAVGESREINVVYFDLPAMDMKPVKQRYTRLSTLRYKYETLYSGFTAEIEVDDQGFVIDYPEIWERVIQVRHIEE
ncbi:putative glycolipid-binding domain-containing protein [Chitinophaga rhizophila]|uniref:Glycolipid-binding domain-containing protein n=1 Tax=Chitinophaga rhizophila TaxID=2866212 RepID=A0ABS7GJN9_9BACT|nr:putative glycolipid-binding domain-containing protein [Chitinophaga rhizophila]MBW8686969.1 putative glycolipid-binding domain-containing protein [Chitinophaga rhizophila]